MPIPHRILLLATLLAALAWPPLTPAQGPDDTGTEEGNKAIAMGFYENLWNSDNTDRYVDYMAERYVIHDIGDEKGLTEPAITQKRIADFFWDNGDMSFELDYQVADGDLVATRWWWRYTPDTLLGRVLFGHTEIPIINVFRIRDGKIVEVWNHRHDIDTRRATLPVALAFIAGLLFAGIPAFIFWRRSRRVMG